MSENNLVTPEVWLNDQHCGFYQSHGHCEEIPHHSENDRGELSHDDIQVVPRTSGQHEDVGKKQEPIKWTVENFINLSPSLEAELLRKCILEGTENERKRRLSSPYSTTQDITDAEMYIRGEKLCSVHEEMLRLFAKHKGSLKLVYWLPDDIVLVRDISAGDFQIRWNALSLLFSERESGKWPLGLNDFYHNYLISNECIQHSRKISIWNT